MTDTVNIPTTTASLAFSKHELIARTEVFLAPDGPWRQLMAAQEKLVELLRANLYTPEYRAFEAAYRRSRNEGQEFRDVCPPEPYRTQPHRPELGQEDTVNMLLGHYGLRGEFVNGPGMMVYYSLIKDDSDLPLEDRIRKVVESFDQQSQLAGGANGRGSVITQKLGYGVGRNPDKPYYEENSRQAFARIADEIELWMKVNRDVIPAAEQTAITEPLGEYRAALKDVLAFVDYAKGYFAQVDTRAASVTNGRGA